MFSKLALVTTAALALAAVAAPGHHGHGGTYNQGKQCQTEKQMCCKHVQDSDKTEAKGLLGLLDIVLDVVMPIGIGCSPITVIGLGSGTECLQEPVCCDQNDFGGLISIGCSPINIYL